MGAKKPPVLRTALEAKFLQTTDLKQVLMDTGERTLGEANPSDTMFGIGLSLHSKDAMNRSKWSDINGHQNGHTYW